MLLLGASLVLPAQKSLMLATTTSVDATGLLDVLADAFAADTGITLRWIAVGTGAALKQARDGNADVVIVHAKKLEDEFVRAGFGVNRRVFARNYFIVVGPADDPARVAGASSAADAFGRVKAAGLPFVSRGDNSGTHARELDLWSRAGGRPAAAYLETGQGMAETLRVAAERRAYTLTDTATFRALKGLAGLVPALRERPGPRERLCRHRRGPGPRPHGPLRRGHGLRRLPDLAARPEAHRRLQRQGRPAPLRAAGRDARGGPPQMIFRELALAVWISLKTSGLAALIASAVAVPAALYLAGHEFRGKRFVLLVNQTWMAAPTVVIGLLFYSLLSRSGPLGRFGLLYTQAAMTVGQVFLVLPLIVGFSYTALRQVDRRARPTALTLGASPRQAGWIVLREARFPLLVAVLAGFARAVSEVGIAMMLGGNIRNATRNITTSIALETAKGEFRNGVVLGVLLLVITLGINVLVQTGLRGSDKGT
ncbi:MAG: ABC transporter permease [Marinilabiliales bacterium]|nr:ABC transporter permease [Marinilabiliales bacterium]